LGPEALAGALGEKKMVSDPFEKGALGFSVGNN
jgi:hypothetical protein